MQKKTYKSPQQNYGITFSTNFFLSSWLHCVSDGTRLFANLVSKIFAKKLWLHIIYKQFEWDQMEMSDTEIKIMHNDITESKVVISSGV